MISVDSVLRYKEMKMTARLTDLPVVDRSIMRSFVVKQFASSSLVVRAIILKRGSESPPCGIKSASGSI